MLRHVPRGQTRQPCLYMYLHCTNVRCFAKETFLVSLRLPSRALTGLVVIRTRSFMQTVSSPPPLSCLSYCMPWYSSLHQQRFTSRLCFPPTDSSVAATLASLLQYEPHVTLIGCFQIRSPSLPRATAQIKYLTLFIFSPPTL